MKTIWILAAMLAASWSGTAAAQSWTLYAPAERDFRVLMPAPPMRMDLPSGSVEFRAEADQRQYSVFRHDPRRVAGGNSAREDIIARLGNGDQTVRSGGEEANLAPNEFMFRVGGAWTMHRAIIESGRYYELVVKAAPDEQVSPQEARDFFNSFQSGSLGAVPVLSNLPGPDSCQARGSTFTRRFCEYLTCLAPGTENHPVCKGLPRLLRN